MDEQKYKIERGEYSSLARAYAMGYVEQSIVNSTASAVVVVSNDGGRITIPPSGIGKFGLQEVVIFIREGIGATLTPNGVTKCIPGKKINIPESAYAYEPLYVKEIDAVICTQDMSSNVKHPEGCVTYDDAMISVTKTIEDALGKSLNIVVTANDPLGRYTKLYTSISNTKIVIPITKIRADAAKVHVIITNDNRVTKQEQDITALLNNDCDIIEIKNSLIDYLTVDKNRSDKYMNDYTRVLQSELDAIKNNYIATHKKAIETIKEEYELKLKEQDNKYTTIKTESDKIKSDYEVLRSQYTGLKGDLTYRAELEEQRIKAQISDNSLKTTQYKLGTEQKEFQFKLWHLATASLLPAVAVIGMKLLELSLKKK